MISQKNSRLFKVSFFSILIALAVGAAAFGFLSLINFITNVVFHGKFSFEPGSPLGHSLGVWIFLVPVAGGILVGIMARFGSPAIRGHGIPEAMEQILFNQSRIAPKVAVLKPLSAAVSIGTGGPFGAEGPIIATGGAIGSMAGQFLHISAAERKVLLASGAAAGMTAVFGSPVSAVLLAVELLLFEYRAASMIPVALAAVTAAFVRILMAGADPFLSISPLSQPGGLSLACYSGLGALAGAAAVAITKLLYAVEDLFERLPLHWMWWPALGGLAVGVVGFFDPRTLGVGYENIEGVLSGDWTLQMLLSLCVLKLVSWLISLGSGTSGGTLAPLLTIGGALGGALGVVSSGLWPSAGIDPRIAALVGMAALFTGASRAFLAAVVFSFEITRQPLGLLPLLAGCAASYLVSLMLMENSIMTEKLVRRGVKVPTEYMPDYLDQIQVREIASRHLVALKSENTAGEIRQWSNSRVRGSTHQGYPVVDAENRLIGVLTMKEIMDPAVDSEAKIAGLIHRLPLTVLGSQTAREAADLMVREKIGRLPVLSDEPGRPLVAMLTRSDLLSAHERRLDEHQKLHRTMRIRVLFLEQLYKKRNAGKGN